MAAQVAVRLHATDCQERWILSAVFTLQCLLVPAGCAVPWSGALLFTAGSALSTLKKGEASFWPVLHHLLAQGQYQLMMARQLLPPGKCYPLRQLRHPLPWL